MSCRKHHSTPPHATTRRATTQRRSSFRNFLSSPQRDDKPAKPGPGVRAEDWAALREVHCRDRQQLDGRLKSEFLSELRTTSVLKSAAAKAKQDEMQEMSELWVLHERQVISLHMLFDLKREVISLGLQPENGCRGQSISGKQHIINNQITR